PRAAKPAGPRTGARTSSPSPGKTRAQGRQYRGSTSRLRVRSIPRRRALPDQAGVGRAASAPFPARGRRARHGPGEIEPASAYHPADARPGEQAMTQPAAKLAQRVNGLLGGDNHVYFVASGSEANEAGFKFARQYTKHENPGQYRYKTISRYLGYHGTTLATLAAGGMGDRKMKFEP